jgi:hydroxypyruvate isomerase
VTALVHSAAVWGSWRDSFRPEEYYAALRRAGYSGVEMADPAHWPAARAAGLELVNILGHRIEHGLNRPEHHGELLPRLRERLRVCADHGIAALVVFSGNRAGQPDELGLAACADALRRLAPDAERAGVDLLLETLSRHDHPDYQADRSAYAVAVARAVGSPRVRVLYDLYHMHRMGERVAESVIANLDVIGHLHVAGAPRRDFPGADQEIAYPAIVRAIHAAGYRGRWGQEFTCGADPLAEMARAVTVFESAVAPAAARG